MAPQQNSTFIDDDSLTKPKLHSNFGIKDTTIEKEEEDEIIKRFSPILPPIPAQLTELKMKDCHAKEMHENQNSLKKKCTKNPQNESKGYNQNNICNKDNRNGDLMRNCMGNNVQNYQYRRSRSISLHGVNSTVEQGQKELTIWVGNEPRYVSGVTKKTTCSDIIKALIDDEIQNGNSEFFQNITKKRLNSRGSHIHQDGGDGICATSRDYSDYVITESWRGIERSYDGNMTILPVWKAWSRVHNELRLRLRHRSDIPDPIQYTKPCRYQSLLRKYLNKLTRLWRKEKPKNCKKIKENCLLLSNNKADIPDEFLFVILPDKVYEKQQRPNKERLQSIPEQPTATAQQRHLSRSKCKQRKKAERGVSANSCIRRRQLNSVSQTIRNSVRYRLAQKTSEMDALYAREFALTRELSEKCKLYRMQNQIYSNPEQQWNISIGQVQRKIENYAREIVRTEHELLELKNEIKQDISLINNLKRMTLERGGGGAECSKAVSSETDKSPRGDELKANNEMQFVDNIYEFCDNNASMLV